MNNAPTDGWEDIVGKKTSLRLAYQCCGSTNVTLFEGDIKEKGSQIAFINYGSSACIDLCKKPVNAPPYFQGTFLKVS